MIAHAFLGLVVFGAIGCSSSYDVRNELAPNNFSFAQVNENARNRSVIISTRDGQEMRATDLFVGGDSTTFHRFDTGENTAIATSNVEAITLKSGGRGAIDGLIIGVIVGVPAGLALGALAGAMEDRDKIDVAVLAGSIGIAATLGASTGAIIRHTSVYIFQLEDNSPKRDK